MLITTLLCNLRLFLQYPTPIRLQHLISFIFLLKTNVEQDKKQQEIIGVAVEQEQFEAIYDHYQNNINKDYLIAFQGCPSIGNHST